MPSETSNVDASSPIKGIAGDPLFQPFTLRHLTLKNRILSTSHTAKVSDNGMPKERYQRYHEEKAKGGLAMTMFGGSASVAPDSSNVFSQLNVGVDEIVPYFQQFAERIHRHNCFLTCQITHLGRRGDPYLGDRVPTIGPSPIRETLHRSFPKIMDENDIARVVKSYGDAAWRCKEGGLDGVETQAGGHLIGQFLSTMTNKRGDRFGGSLENRCRFGLLVQREIRRRVGPDFIVGMRWIVDEGPDGGLTAEESVIAAKWLEAEGVDFFSAMYGKMDTFRGLSRDMMPGMDSPLAPWVEPVGRFKREVSVPVFHAARILDIASARYALKAGHIDMVGMTRAHFADPHLVSKLIEGRETQIRPCVGATYCLSEQGPSCLHNPATGHEEHLPQLVSRAASRRKVVIVGGGPAGMEAARVCAERGHEVVLFEAADELGGQIRLAIRSLWRRDLVGVIDWRAAEIERLGVDVRLNSYIEQAEVDAEGAEVVIIATGGSPDLEWIDGKEHCTGVWDVLAGGPTASNLVTIVDATGRHPALQAAEQLARAGSKVQLVSIDDFIGADLGYSERVAWKRRLHGLDIAYFFDHHLKRVSRDAGGLISTLRSESDTSLIELRSDRVVVECGTLPAEELFESLKAASCNDGVTDLDALLAGSQQPWSLTAAKRFELHRIGDAVSSRNIHTAILDALRLCAVL